jgi:hypothetical protein
LKAWAVFFLYSSLIFASYKGQKVYNPRLVELSMGCIGTLINTNTVLTAAHCFSDKLETKKVLGKYYQERDIKLGKVSTYNSQNKKPHFQYKILSFTVHPKFDYEQFEQPTALQVNLNDIAIVKIKNLKKTDLQLLDFPLKIAAINLLSNFKGHSYSNKKPYDTYAIPLILEQQTNTHEVYFKFFKNFFQRVFKIKKRGLLCPGDSGSPLFQQNEQEQLEFVGLVSRGSSFFSKCQAATHVMYTLIAPHLNWITQQIKHFPNVKLPK